MVIRKEEAVKEKFQDLAILDYTTHLKLPFSFATIKVKRGRGHSKGYSTKCDKYYYLMRGSITFIIEGTVVLIKRGDMLLIKKDQIFEYYNNDAVISELALIHVPPFDMTNEHLI